jgi:hypothetical protein
MCSPIKQGFHGVFHPHVCEIPTLLHRRIDEEYTRILYTFTQPAHIPYHYPKEAILFKWVLENPSFNLDAFNNLWCNWEAMDLFVIAKLLANHFFIMCVLFLFFLATPCTYYLEQDYNIITLGTSLNCVTICHSMSALNVLNLLKGCFYI